MRVIVVAVIRVVVVTRRRHGRGTVWEMRSVVGRLLVAAVAERSRGARLVFQVGDVILHVFRNFRHHSGREDDGQRGSCLMAGEQRMHLNCI